MVRELPFAPAPPDNPLKGLVPYAGPKPGARFPYTLEFSYLALADLMTGPDTFRWDPLERLLDDVAGRGRQAVFRVWLEYPRKPTGIPRYLIEAGLRVHTYTNDNTQPLPPALVTTPDYEDPRLRAALVGFVRALGARYDGDPRIGFITAGLLGTWGEWHTHPRRDLWASKEVQAEILDAYEAAFRRTPVLVRYPAGPGDRDYADNAERRLGYHDDSFGYATRHTGRPREGWFFETLLRKAGPAAREKWRHQPIGGEVRPEVWTCAWDDPPCTPPGQDLAACIEDTHVTWLMDSGTVERGAFGKALTDAHLERATNAVRRMGYALQITRAQLRPAPPGAFPGVSITVTNHGVAPFSRDWTVELGMLEPDGRLHAWPTTGVDLRRILPGQEVRVSLAPATRTPLLSSPRSAAPGRLLLLRVPNPLPSGRPLRFANTDQDADLPGWLTLVRLPAGPPAR